MTLETLDWATITRADAKRLRVVAAAREKTAGMEYEAFIIETAEFVAASNLEINLYVFAICGAKPED